MAHPTKVSNPGAFAILVFGLLSVILNYMADYQKEKFKVREHLFQYLTLISGIGWRMFNMGEESKVHPCGIQNTSGQDKEEQIVDQVNNTYVCIKYVYVLIVAFGASLAT